MKTKQIILPAVLAAFTAGGIAAYSLSTFASDEASSTTTDNTCKCGPEEMSGHKGGMRGERMGGGMFGIQQYIDVDSLTDDQKTTYETALNTFHETMKTNREANKDSTGDNTAMQESMKTAWTTFMQSVRSLVSSDKLTEFDAFVAKGPQAPTMDEGKGEGRGERMGGMFGIQQYIDFDSLTGDTKTAFDAIVKDHQEKVKAAIESAKATSGDNTTTQETMKTLWTEFMTSIRPYVSSDKLTEFDAFVAKGPQAPAMGKGKGMGGMGKHNHNSSSTDDSSETDNQ